MGGANQFEPPDKTGLASMTAAMMSEGTTSRDAESLSKALQLLGTTVSTSVLGESGSIGFVSASGKFTQTLDLLADILLNPTFPDAVARAHPCTAPRRPHARKVTARDDSRSRLPPDPLRNRPSVRPVTTEESLKSISRDDVAAFHKMYFQPGRALVTVVGDVDPAVLKPQIEKSLAAWPCRRRASEVRLSGARLRRRPQSISSTDPAQRSRSCRSDNPGLPATRRTTSRCRS